MLSGTAPGRSLRAADALLFLTLFAAYAWFHQGGGWNQNARFSQVRAIVETGRLAINAFWVWTPVVEEGRVVLRRHPLPLPFVPGPDRPLPNGFDVSVHEGRIYPNKPPGTTLLALPAGWLSERVERGLGLDLDAWWPLTLRLYAMTVLSVGLLGAAGGVVFRRVSSALFPELAPPWHVGAALVFGLGSPIWPYATLLMDHVPHAVLLLAAFGLVYSACAAGGRTRAWRLAGAGLAGGLAVVVNYSALLGVGPLAVYAAIRLRSAGALAAGLAGLLPPLLLLGAYHRVCFGGVLTIANAFQPESFQSKDAMALGVFGWPDPGVLLRLLFSEHRGLFVHAPALLVGVAGLLAMLRGRRLRLEGVLFGAVTAAFLAMNASFNGWHGGSAFGPRYLVPAVPFLALPLAPLLRRWPRSVGAISLVSAGIALLGTTVDVQVPVKVRRPLTEYLIATAAGRAGSTGRVGIDEPVSVNPQGVYEVGSHRVFPPHSIESRWNSFNLGELLFPGQLVSLAPLLVWLAASVPITLHLAARGAPPLRPGSADAGPFRTPP
jgi:hypothetical protein